MRVRDKYSSGHHNGDDKVAITEFGHTGQIVIYLLSFMVPRLSGMKTRFVQYGASKAQYDIHVMLSVQVLI